MRFLTVTLNAAVDLTYLLPSVRLGGVNRVPRVLATPGGKGNNVARLLARLGHRVTATGFIGGHAGRFIAEGVAAAGVRSAFATLAGESRRCLTLVEAPSGRVTELLEPGLAATPVDGERFLQRAAALAAEADWAIISGSLPPGLAPGYYAKLLATLRRPGLRLVLDTSGEPLRLGAYAGPDLIKPNESEMEALTGRPCLPAEAVRFAQAELLGNAMPADGAVLLSLGARGAVLIRAGHALAAAAPEVAVVNPVGAGDALLAGFVHAGSRGGRRCRGARLGGGGRGCRHARAGGGRVRPLRGGGPGAPGGGPRRPGDGLGAAMSDTYREALAQPESWSETLRSTPAQWGGVAGRLDLPARPHYLFVGCGTSYHLAHSAAHSFQEITGRVAGAAPASEVFLSPRSTVPAGVPIVAFVISRSGSTTEALIAADYLREKVPDARVVALTCGEGTELAARAHAAIELPHAAEESVVMTRSFTSMLLALQVVAAEVAGDRGLRRELERLPGLAADLLASFEGLARAVGSDLGLGHFVYLGLGAYFGLAEEATLKLKEMTQVPCEAYNPLEFRHGPVSILTSGTAVVMLEGERDREYSRGVEGDVKRLGARLVTVAPFDSAAAHETFLLPGGLSDLARCVLYLPAVQLIAYYRALALGLDPDRPRFLSRVVVVEPR